MPLARNRHNTQMWESALHWPVGSPESELSASSSRYPCHHGCATVFLRMATRPQNPPPEPGPGSLYCPNCAKEVNDPLTCGDCSSVICRRCGTPLESPDELGIG
jgi:hypothetical protein